MFQTVRLSQSPTMTAPDGAAVRVLPGLSRGGMAQFTLRPGQISRAVRHRTVEELWFVLSGRGAVWCNAGGRDAVLALDPGVALTLPLATRFQFRALGGEPLRVLGLTMPPWPGQQEAVVVEGPWTPTV